VAILARRVVVSAAFPDRTGVICITCYNQSRGLSSQTRNSCQWPVFWSN